MNLSRYLPAITLLLSIPALAPAQEKLSDGAKVTKLDVRPTKVELSGPFSYSQLLVTATLDNGETADVTRIAKIETRPDRAYRAGQQRALERGRFGREDRRVASRASVFRQA
jgi:hypothetical protein